MVQVATLLLFVPCLVLLMVGFAKQSRARLLALCLVLISLFTSGQRAFAQLTNPNPDLLINGGFETGQGTRENFTGTNWTPTAGAARMTLNQHGLLSTHGGSYAVELDEVADLAPPGNESISQVQMRNDLQPGHTYEFGVWLSRENISSGTATIEATIQFLGANGNPIVINGVTAQNVTNHVYTIQGTSVSPQGNWQWKRNSAVCPPNAAGFRVSLRVVPAGQTWGANNGIFIDDVTFKIRPKIGITSSISIPVYGYPGKTTTTSSTITASSLNGYAPITSTYSGIPTVQIVSGFPSGSVVSLVGMTAVSPGQNRTGNLQITCPTTATPGTYSVSIRLVDSLDPTIQSDPINFQFQVVNPPFVIQRIPSTGLSAGSPVVMLTGTSANLSGFTLSTNSTSTGYTGTSQLSATGMPSGMTVQFTPTSIPLTSPTTPGNVPFSVLITCSNAVNAGTYTLQLRATDGSLVATVPFYVQVRGKLGLSTNPSSLTVTRSSSGNASITVTSQNGYSGAANLSLDTTLPANVPPAGMTATFSPAQVNLASGGTAPSTLTVSCNSSVAAGTYTLKLKASDPVLPTNTTTIDFVVTVPQAKAEVTVPATELVVPRGSFGDVVATIKSLGGFTGFVTLQREGTTPTELSATFTPGQVNLTTLGAMTTSTVRVQANTSILPGLYSFNVKGITGNAATESPAATIPVRIPVGTLSLSSSQSLTVARNASASGNLSLVSAQGYIGPANLQLVVPNNKPTGMTVVFTPASSNITGNGTTPIVVQASCDNTVSPGTYTMDVKAIGQGADSNPITLTVTVPTPVITLSAVPTALTILTTGQGQSTLTLLPSNGYRGSPVLSVVRVLNGSETTLPTGMSATFTPASPSVQTTSSVTSTMQVVCSNVAAGTYSLRVRAIDGTIQSNPVAITVTVPAPDFTLSATPLSITTYQGANNKTSTLTLTPQNGFTGNVNLAISSITLNGSPATGITGAFVPNSVVISNTTAQNSIVTFNVAPTAALGLYSVKAQAASGTITKEVTFAITVNEPPLPPLAPSVLTATAIDWNEVKLTWVDNSTGNREEDNVVIYRKKEKTFDWVEIATVGSNVTTFTDKSIAFPLVADTAYEYKVKSVNASGESPWSNVAYVTTIGSPTYSKGTEFWLAFPTNVNYSGATKLLSLTILGVSGTQGNVEVPNANGIGIQTIPYTISALGKAVVYLPVHAEVLGNDTIEKRGIRVTASDPVTIQAFNDTFSGLFSSTEDYLEGYLALPTAALGTEYIIVDCSGVTQQNIVGVGGGGDGDGGVLSAGILPLSAGAPAVGSTISYVPVAPAQVTIVATADDTIVRIKPSADVTVLGVKHLAGVEFTVTLDKGQVLQIQRYSPFLFNIDGLTGTAVSASKPVAVYGGAKQGWAMRVFSYIYTSSNHVVEQMIPVKNWGTEFFAMPLRHSDPTSTVPTSSGYHGTTYRVVAAEDGTWVKVNGVLAGTLKQGQFFIVPDFYQTSLYPLLTPIHIESNLPIQVAQYSHNFSIYGAESPTYGRSGTFMSLVPAVEQYVKEATFVTPRSDTNVAIKHNYVTVITPQSGIAGLQLNGSVLNANLFTPIDNTNFYGATLKVNTDVQRLTSSSDIPFGVMAYGYAHFYANNAELSGSLQYRGYAYPAGLTLRSKPTREKNIAPEVEITNIPPDTQYTFPVDTNSIAAVSLPVEVLTKDLDGQVVRVEYQVLTRNSEGFTNGQAYIYNKILSQNSTVSPFGTTLNFNVQLGPANPVQHLSIRAIAFDNKGYATTHEVYIKIKDPNINLDIPEVRIVKPAYVTTASNNRVAKLGPPSPLNFLAEAIVTSRSNNLSQIIFELKQGNAVLQTATKPAVLGVSTYNHTFNNVAEGIYTLRVTAIDNSTNGNQGASEITVHVLGSNSLRSARRINSGGGATTVGSTVWSADTNYFSGIAQTLNLPGVSDLYKTIRVAEPTGTPGGGDGFTYVFPMEPNTKATLKLHFIEGAGVTAGQRVFNVVDNDYGEDPLLTNFDVAAEVGAGVPLVKTFDVYADENGWLALTFSNVFGEAMVSAIELIPHSEGLVCGTSVQGSLDDTDESMTIPGQAGNTGPFLADRYKFAGKTGQQVTITAAKGSGNFTPHIYLLAPEGYILKESTTSTINGVVTATLAHTLNKNANYTIVVSSSHDIGAPSNATGDYTVLVSCQDNQGTSSASPSDLVARAASDPREMKIENIELSWLDNSNDEERFEVYRKTPSSSTWLYMGYIEGLSGLGRITIQHKNLRVAQGSTVPPVEQEKAYEYQVKAIKGTLPPAVSNVAPVNTYLVPPVVTILSPTEKTTLSIPSEQTSRNVVFKIAASASKGKDIPATNTNIVLKANGVPVAGATVTRDAQKKNLYEITVPNVVAGDYRLSVTVTDDGGVSNTTPSQWLTVGDLVVATPTISSVGTFNNGIQAFEITNGTPDTTIYYSIGYGIAAPVDPVPGTLGVIKYTGPFVLYRTGKIKARAYRGNIYADATTPTQNIYPVAIDNPGKNFARIAKQPDAYFNKTSKLIIRGVGADGAPTSTDFSSGVEIFTGKANIWGEITGPNVASWELSYRSLESDSRGKTFDSNKGWTPITSSVGPYSMGKLGEFDTTMLANGQYEFRTRVYNVNHDPTNVTDTNYSDTFRTGLVEGGQKSGPFTISLTDLTLPAPGFPIAVSRSYDSTDKTIGEFGIGWRLGVNNIRVQMSATGSTPPVNTGGGGPPGGGGGGSSSDDPGRSRALGDGWKELYSPIAQSYYLVPEEPHYINISLPGGATYGFHAIITPESSGTRYNEAGAIVPVKMTFKPIPGTQADRESTTSEFLPGARLLAVMNDGTVTDGVSVGVDYLDDGQTRNGVTTRRAQLVPDSFSGYNMGALDVKFWLLITRDGTKFYIDMDKGVTRIVDTNGNEVIYTYDEKRGANKGWYISQIETWRNTASGVVKTRELGLNWVNGFIDNIIDPAGSTIVYTRNAKNDLIKVKNRMNAESDYAYDNNHNLIQLKAPPVAQTVPASVVALFPAGTFPATIQPTVTNRYDEKGRFVASEDKDGISTVVSNYPSERRTIITDPTGKSSMMAYDDIGNVRLTATYSVETEGATTVTRPIQSKATYPYWQTNYTNDNPLNKYATLKTQDESQIDRIKTQAQLDEERIKQNNPNLQIGDPIFTKHQYVYDVVNTPNSVWKMGDLLETKDALGKSTRMKYDAYGHLLETRDANRLAEGKRPTSRNVYEPVTGNLVSTKTALNFETSMKYNPSGLPSETMDALGAVTKTVYDFEDSNAVTSLGNVTKVIDALNHDTEYKYNDVQAGNFAPGVLGLKTRQIVKNTKIVNGQPVVEAVETRFEYDREGRVVKTISPTTTAGQTRTSQTIYNEQGKVSESVNADGRSTKYFYDAKGRQVATQDASGRVSRTMYNAAGQVETTFSPSGATSETIYNSLGQVVKTISKVSASDPNPVVNRSVYDDAGRVVKSYTEDLAGTRSIVSGTSEYDDNGQVIKSFKPNPNNTTPVLVGEYKYDDAGRSRWSMDASGKYSVPVYDEDGRVFKSYSGLSAMPTFDAQGNFIVPANTNPISETVFDSLGRQILTRDGAGRVMAYGYDIAGRLVAVSQAMNATGAPNGTAQSLAAGVLPTNLQDIQISKVAEWNQYLALFDRNSTHGHLVTEYFYDDLGRKISQKDALGRETKFEYDLLGRQVKRTLPMGQQTQMFYRTDGKLDYTQDFNGKFTKFLYFDSGVHFGKLQEKYPALDAIGTRPAPTNPNYAPGIVYEYYDGIAGDPNGIKDFGRRKSVTYGGNQVGYLYDERGQLKERVTLQRETVNDPWKVMGRVAYTYDPLTGSKKSTTTYAGTTVTGTTYFKYDFEERLKDIGYSVGEPIVDPDANATQLAEYDYNENGSLMTVKRGGTVVGGVVTNPFFTSNYEYTDKNELLSIIHTGLSGANATTVASASRFYYTVDASGKRTGIANGNDWTNPPAAPTTPIPGTKYQYDLAGRLIEEKIPAATVGGNANTPKIVSYTYDKVGNRKTRSESPAGGVAGQPVVTTTYTYDSNDRLVTSVTGSNRIVSTYDDNGNLIADNYDTGASTPVVKTVARTFTFEGKITKETTYENMLTTKETFYNYDGEGNRIGVARVNYQTPGYAWTYNEYLVDTSQPYAEVIQEVETIGTGSIVGVNRNNMGLLYRYDIGLDRLRVNRYSIQANAPNGVGTMTPTSPNPSAWYVFDGLGSTRALVSDSGVVLDGFGYEDAFGKPYSLSGANLTAGFFLNGQQWDGFEGLYFNRARYHQPTTGRFIGQDPYAGSEYQAATLHRYLYTGNDPVNNIDPSGNFTMPEIMSVLGNMLRIAIGVGTFLNATGIIGAHPANAPTPNSVNMNKPSIWQDVGEIIASEAGGRAIAWGAFALFKKLAPSIMKILGRQIYGEALDAGKNVTVFSGHGSWEPLRPETKLVPEGTTLYVYVEKGAAISNDLGQAIESLQVRPGVYRRAYHAGEPIPSFNLHAPGNLDILHNQWVITTSVKKPLSELLVPNMGEVHWAACASSQYAPTKNLVYTTGWDDLFNPLWHP
jgi:RHS repeat-associated protein